MRDKGRVVCGWWDFSTNCTSTEILEIKVATVSWLSQLNGQALATCMTCCGMQWIIISFTAMGLMKPRLPEICM